MSPETSIAVTTSTRVVRVRERMRREGWDALVVLDETDVQWLTGLQSSNAAAIVTDDRCLVATDFRYVAAAEALDLDVARIEQSMFADLGGVVATALGSGGGVVAYPPSGLSHRAFLVFTEHMPDGLQLRAGDNVIADLRAVKDDVEVDRIRRASALLEGAYGLIANEGLEGKTERDVAWMIERHLREAGALALSFDSIVAGGANGAMAHHHPSSDRIPPDTLVTIDMGCVLDGYCSDCTRTFAVGTPSARLLEIYDVTLRAQQAALAAVRPGAAGRDVDAIARDIITEAGYGDYFGHGLGHGVGMQVHEAPRLSRASEDILEPGHVVTVEPGIYLPGEGGVRIEDLVVVTSDGYELLTHVPKQLTYA